MSRRRKILIFVGIVLSVAILIPVIRHYQLRFAVESYISELKAKGEPMELAQVIPPPVPPEQNSADVLRKADELFNEEFAADKSLLETNFVYGMRMVAPGEAMVRWRQPDVRDIDGTNSWENVTKAVSRNSKAFALLQQIVAKPNFDFHVDYSPGVADLNFTNFYLSQCKAESQRLESATLCDLHRGDTASAVKNLRAMLALVKAMRDERLVISELVRIAIAQIALTANWEFLQSTNLTGEQLTELQQDWASLDFVQSEENALKMERVIGEITLARWRSSNTYLESYFDVWERFAPDSYKESFYEKNKINAKIFLWRKWWSYPDEMLSLKGYDELLTTTEAAKTNFSWLSLKQAQEHRLQEMANTNEDFWFAPPEDVNFHFILSSSIDSLSHVFEKVIRAETAKQMSVVAIALKRYQIKHGKYPATLSELDPEFLSFVPLDPVDGEPLRYKLNSDGTFLLYSIGEDGKDDGGNPSLEKGVTGSNFYWQNPHALDWVWPQPATEEEIQKYYEKQAGTRN